MLPPKLTPRVLLSRDERASSRSPFFALAAQRGFDSLLLSLSLFSKGKRERSWRPRLCESAEITGSLFRPPAANPKEANATRSRAAPLLRRINTPDTLRKKRGNPPFECRGTAAGLYRFRNKEIRTTTRKGRRFKSKIQTLVRKFMSRNRKTHTEHETIQKMTIFSAEAFECNLRKRYLLNEHLREQCDSYGLDESYRVG